MKKISWIIALLAALSLMFVACPPPEPPPPPPAGDLVIDTPAEIAELLSTAGWHGSGDGVFKIGNVAHFNIPTGSSSDNQGFKIDFPQQAKDNAYLSMTVTWKLTELTTITAGKKAKIGFKASLGADDITPYADYELHFEEVGDEFSLTFPMNKLPNKALWFSNNQYEDGSPVPVNYKLEITKIVFKGGEAVPPECTCEDEDCDCDCEEDCGPVCPDCDDTDNTPEHPGAGELVLGAFNIGNGGNQGGWAVNGVDGLDTTMEYAHLYYAKYLVLEMPTAPVNGLQLIWQGDYPNWGAWNQSNILNDTGGAVAELGISFEGSNLKIELSKALKDYDNLLKCTQVKIIIAFYNTGVADLGITKAYLVIE